MKNYTTKSTNKLLISFLIKSILTTIITIFAFTFLASEIVLKADIDLSKLSIISLIIVGISSIIISFISVYSMRNSGAIFGIISQIPLVFYMLINVVFHSSNWLFFIIKLVMVMLIGALGGILASEKSKKIRVK